MEGTRVRFPRPRLPASADTASTRSCIEAACSEPPAWCDGPGRSFGIVSVRRVELVPGDSLELAAGDQRRFQLSARLASTRPRCGPHADGASRPPGDGVRAAGWAAADQRAVRDGAAAPRICGLRAFADPRAGAGFRNRTARCGGDHPARRSEHVGASDPCRGARSDGRWVGDRRRHRSSRVPRGSDLEASADRVPRRRCRNGRRRAAARACWASRSTRRASSPS